MDEIKSSRRRNGEIDFLRFVFAVMIMLHHSRYVVGDEACRYMGGSLAVEFYFVVSGYLLAASALRAGERTHAEGLGSETYRFVTHKIKAILPEWLVAWFIGFGFVLYADQVRTIREAGVRFVNYFWELSLLRSSGLHIAALDGVMWYLTSMFLCMAILYPLLRKWPDMMVRIGCPLMALLLLGYLYQTTGTLRNPHDWLGWTFKGNVRAMAELCCGIVCYYAARRFRRIPLTTFGRVLVLGAEILLYGAAIRYMLSEVSSTSPEYDFTVLFVLVMAVILSFSGQGIQTVLFQNPVVSRVCAWLAAYATTLFVSHLYLAQHFENFVTNHGAALGLSVSMSDERKMLVYVGAALVNSLIVMGICRIIRTHGRHLLAPLHKLLIV